MTLPELGAQFVYARIAWGLLLAALLLAAWRCRGDVALRQAGVVTLLSMGVMWLPGAASPAYWLGLALQQPSVLLAALCGLSLHRPAGVRAPLLAPAAPWLAGLGVLLYVDALGWSRFEWYALGAQPRLAPVLALVLGGMALAVLRTPALRPSAGALLVAVFGFSVLRLPTGNLFDALLDPLLWLACVALTAASCSRRLRRRASAATQRP